MSVPTWKRNISGVDFLERLFQLNLRVGEIVANKPKKYRENYGDFLIKSALEALQCAQVANDIFPTKNTPQSLLEDRTRGFKRAIGLCNNISTSAYIFLEQCKKSDGISNAKICKEEAEIGDACDEICKLIDGVIKSDKKYKG